MNRSSVTLAERAGSWLGRGWLRYRRQEARAIRWLGDNGAPAGWLRPMFLGVKFALLAFLLMTMFWLIVLIALVAALVWLMRNNTDFDHTIPAQEWRIGSAGFGLYTYDGHRIDPHVHDDG